MTIIICVDDQNGMLFGGRRQSRDRAVTARILELSKGHTLWVSPYTAKLFADNDPITVDAAYANKAAREDFCFAEDGAIPTDHAEQIVLYRWNRRYPADCHFPFDPAQNGYTLTSHTDFAGYSHETITEDVYTKA